MRCPTCGVECRVDSSTEVLKFICRSKQCPRFGLVVGELAPGEAVQRVSYPVTVRENDPVGAQGVAGQ